MCNIIKKIFFQRTCIMFIKVLKSNFLVIEKARKSHLRKLQENFGLNFFLSHPIFLIVLFIPLNTLHAVIQDVPRCAEHM